jgi:SNF2 family DNA or RNA helicase
MHTRDNLKRYQQKAVEFLKQHPGAALWLDMGLGKTVITLTALADLKDEGKLPPVLLLSTIRIVQSVWRQEAAKWAHTRGLTFSLVHGSAKERRAALARKADVYLMNFENVKWLHEDVLDADKPAFGALVVDESSRVKAHNTKRFKALRRMLPPMVWRWLLTGTPAPNSLLDLWSQMFLLDEGAVLGRTFYHYRQRFFESKDWMGYSYGPRPNAERQIYRAVAPMVMRLDAADFLTMPKVQFNTIRLSLPAPARAQYEELERRMFLDLDNMPVEAFNAAALTTKCWQFANGAVYGSNAAAPGAARDWRPVHDGKLDALDEVIEEAQGKPVLVAYWFKSDLERLRQRLGAAVPVLQGKHADRMVDTWNAGGYPVMLAHPQTAAHGLNLQAGGHIMFLFSQMWSLELHLQLIARLARQGQKYPVMVHVPVVSNTVDDVIVEAIAAKQHSQGALLHALRRYRDIKELL